MSSLYYTAYERGQRWANSLKIGDVFFGAMPTAEGNYPGDTLLKRLFFYAAMEVLDKRIICTDTAGIVTRNDPR